jgi:ribosomal protein S18 acetylase RimI-like enzyme
VVGFCVIRNARDRAEVLRMAVLPKFRRRGIGSAFLRLAESRMVAGRCREGVWVAVHEHNPGSVEWVLANGYEGRTVARNYFGESDAWVFGTPEWKLMLNRTQARKVVVA